MAYPSTLDTTSTIPVESTSTPLSTNHVINHTVSQTAIIALETKVGIDGDTNNASHDFKLSEILTTDKAVGKTATQTLTNKTLTSPVVNVGSDATGDMYYRNAGVLTRIPVGTDNQIMKLNGTTPNWEVETVTVNGSTTVAGIFEAATVAETSAGTATGATGAVLVVTPDSLATSAPTFSGANLTSLPLNIYTTSSSANQKLAADNTSATISAGSITKVKEIILNYGGVVSCYYEAQGNGTGITTSQVFVNGVAQGTQRTPLTNGSYTAYTEDFTVNAGDRIQLLINGAGGGQATAKNFRIRYDKTISNEGLVVTN